MDTFQTPPTHKKCLLFYWPLIFFSRTFYVLVLLDATFSPLYNLSTLHMHSSVLGVLVSESNNWHISSGSVMLKSLHLRRNANSAFFPAIVSLAMVIAMPLVLCNYKPRYLNDWTRSWLSLCMWTLALHYDVSQTPPPWSCSHWWPIVVQHRTQIEHLFVSATFVGSLTSMPNYLHTAIIWLLCMLAVAGYRHQVHLDASQVHQSIVQKTMG